VGADCTWWCAWTSNPVEGMVDMSSVGSIPTRSRQIIKNNYQIPTGIIALSENKLMILFFRPDSSSLSFDKTYIPIVLFQ